MSQTICCHINETLVQGEITHYDAYDMTVEITQPFSGFTAGCHVPYFARQHKDYKGEKGQEKAIELLTGLYKDLLTVHSNKTALQKKAVNLAAELQAILDEQTLLRHQKASLRKTFKSHKISQSVYQTELKTLRDREFALDTKADSLKTAFFEKNIPGLGGFVDLKQLCHCIGA